MHVTMHLHSCLTTAAFHSGFKHSYMPDMSSLSIHMCVFRDHCPAGMSGDFEKAIECGSTSVRVGTSIFGARASKK
jgi:uncharacterized pyridoxal phosphate-containing UPF0001 family protein